MIKTMNNNSGLILGAIVLALVAGLVGYLIGSQKDVSQQISQTPETVQTTTDRISSFKYVTLGEQNESGQVGVATLTEENGKVKVNINFVGAPEGAKQPAHIHTGSCPNPGAIVNPLTDVVDGESETILDTTMGQLDSQIPLAINIHKSAQELSAYVACGNLPD